MVFSANTGLVSLASSSFLLGLGVLHIVVLFTVYPWCWNSGSLSRQECHMLAIPAKDLKFEYSWDYLVRLLWKERDSWELRGVHGLLYWENEDPRYWALFWLIYLYLTRVEQKIVLDLDIKKYWYIYHPLSLMHWSLWITVHVDVWNTSFLVSVKFELWLYWLCDLKIS